MSDLFPKELEANNIGYSLRAGSIHLFYYVLSHKALKQCVSSCNINISKSEGK